MTHAFARAACSAPGLALVCFGAVALGAVGVLAQVPPPPEQKPDQKAEQQALEAIVGATVLPVSGPPIHRGTVIFRGAKIVAVGAELPVPAEARVHRADGKYVSPGLVAIEAARIGTSGAPGRIADGLDPYDRDMRIALASGITCAHVVESGFGGFFGLESSLPVGPSTAVVKTTVGDLEGMLVKEPAALYLSFRQSPLGVYGLRDGFRRAAEHLRRAAEAERAKARPPSTPQDLERYVRILRGDLPVVAVVDSDEEARTLLELRRQHPFDLVLSAQEGLSGVARELALDRVPVLTRVRGRDFNFDLDVPVVPEDGIMPIARPAALSRSGVAVSILPYRRGVSLDGLAGRDLTALHLEAAFAVRGGLDEDAALRAITLEPARVLRLGDRLGSLDPGKDADLLIWSRHPLDYRSFVETAFINGKVYYERSRSSLFRDIPLR